MSDNEAPKPPKDELEDPQKDKEIAELREKVADLEKKDEKIKSLEADLAAREEKLSQVNQELKTRQDELIQLRASETTNKESIKDLEHRLSQKELEITRLEGSVEDLSIAKKKIEDLQKEYKKLEEEMRAFQKIAENEHKVLQYELIGWHGKCEVHDQFTVDDITNARKQFPDVVVLSHPECPPEVVEASDFSGSTSRMIDYVKNSKAENYMLLTECSMGDNIIAENPDKEMVCMCSIRCPHMNEITLEDTLAALRMNQYQVEVEEELRLKAKKSIDRMLEFV